LSKAAAYALVKFWYGRQEDPGCETTFAFRAFKSASDSDIIFVEEKKRKNPPSRQRKEKPSAVGTDDERMEDSDGDDTPTSNTPVTSSRTKLSKRTPKVVKELPFAAHQRDPVGVGMASRPKTIIQNSEEGPSAKKQKMEAKGKMCAIGGKG
jgi:hypothetical protein